MRESLSRAAVVSAARALLSSEGPGGLSLRRLASRLNVTAAALYAYVDNKGDLLHAILESELDALRGSFAAQSDGDPITRLCRVSWTYLQHARSNAKIFRTMLVARAAAGSPADQTAFNQAFDATLPALLAGIEQGLLRVADARLAHQTLWTTVQGTSAILLLGPPLSDSNANLLCDSVVRTVVRGLCSERGAELLERVALYEPAQLVFAAP